MSAAGLRRQLSLLRAAVGYEHRKATAFRAGFVVRELISGFDRPVVMIFVYLAIFRSSGAAEVGGFSYREMVAYLVLAATFWKVVVHERLLDLSEQIFDGYVTKFLVMPFRFFLLVLGRFIQYTSVQLVAAAAVWLLGWTLLPGWWPIPASPRALGQAVVLVLLGSYCYLLLLFVLNALAFWLDVVWTLLVMSRFVVGFVSGQLIPVSMMPEPLRSIFFWTFPYWTLSAPVEIVMGRLGSAEFLQGLGVLAATALSLHLLAAWTWQRGLLRYQGVGA